MYTYMLGLLCVSILFACGYFLLQSLLINFNCKLNRLWRRSLSEDVTAHQEEVKTQIKTSLEDIRNNSATVGLITQDYILNFLVNVQCLQIQQWEHHCENELHSGELEPLLLTFSQSIKELNVVFNIRNADLSAQQLGDVIFYYMMRGEAMPEFAEIIMYTLYLLSSQGQGSWYPLFCTILGREDIFSQFYARLGHNIVALKYFLQKQRFLLLKDESYCLMGNLIERLPHEYVALRQILKDIRDMRGQTHMFRAAGQYVSYVKLYVNNSFELYELLSIQDIEGQTALHVNTVWITKLLADIYTPKQRSQYMDFISITDNENKIAQESFALRSLSLMDGTNEQDTDDPLTQLTSRVVNNEYVTHKLDHTNILIIYSTIDRSGAEEEAQTIYEACKSTFRENNIIFERNKTKQEIIGLIKNSSNKQCTALIVILASHGEPGTINDCNSDSINLSTIEEAMCSKALNGKPKVLITQCCQRGTRPTDPDDNVYVPTHDDFCAVMSCVVGEMSIRGVFLEKLAEKIPETNQETDIFKIVSNVSAAMRREGHSQTLIIMGTLKATYFPTDSWIEVKPSKVQVKEKPTILKHNFLFLQFMCLLAYYSVLQIQVEINPCTRLLYSLFILCWGILPCIYKICRALSSTPTRKYIITPLILIILLDLTSPLVGPLIEDWLERALVLPEYGKDYAAELDCLYIWNWLPILFVKILICFALLHLVLCWNLYLFFKSLKWEVHFFFFLTKIFIRILAATLYWILYIIIY